ncbi:unnamed protein product [Mytilus coruscus]|uniref:Uncharacterized protein n=1 Tax=Mytilus coruscus TaxID=42192 RepID=A0A6J8CEH7_MYTCO|nr:unnamed protein product [Mytilus coruscus]
MLAGFFSMPTYLIAGIVGCIIISLGIVMFVLLKRRRLRISAAHNHAATTSGTEPVQNPSINQNFQNTSKIDTGNYGDSDTLHNQLTLASTESTGIERTPGGSLFDNVEPSSNSTSSEPNVAVSDRNIQLTGDLGNDPHQYDDCIPERYYNTLPYKIVDNIPHIYDECGPAEQSSNVYEPLVKEKNTMEHVYL